MSRTLKYVEIDDAPDVLKLAEDVNVSNEPVVLRRNGEDIAVLEPMPRSRKPHRATPEERREAFRSAAGSWKGIVDGDKLIAEIYADRRRSNRPVPEL
jgi:hypothetical protein